MKIAVITGAAGGMGRAIAKKLIADQVKVYGLDKDESGLTSAQNELGDQFVPMPIDLTQNAQIQDIFASIHDNEEAWIFWSIMRAHALCPNFQISPKKNSNCRSISIFPLHFIAARRPSR